MSKDSLSSAHEGSVDVFSGAMEVSKTAEDNLVIE